MCLIDAAWYCVPCFGSTSSVSVHLFLHSISMSVIHFYAVCFSENITQIIADTIIVTENAIKLYALHSWIASAMHVSKS